MNFREIVAACLCLVVLGVGCSSESTGDSMSPSSTQAPTTEFGTVDTMDEEVDPLSGDRLTEPDPTLDVVDTALIGADNPLIDVCASAAFGDEAPIGLVSGEELRDVAAVESIDVQNLIEDCLAAE